jgi:hypothetical protein
VLVSYIYAEIVVSPINHPVAFIHESDAVFTDDRWNAIVKFDLTQHDDAMATLEENLHTEKTMAEQTTSIGELRQVEIVVHSIAEKLASIRHFLPRNSRKRGLFNVGGSMLKSLFFTATILDLDALHMTIDEIEKKQDAVTHSLDRQVTYFKQLDDTVKFVTRPSLIDPPPLKILLNERKKHFRR